MKHLRLFTLTGLAALLVVAALLTAAPPVTARAQSGGRKSKLFTKAHDIQDFRSCGNPSYRPVSLT